jgi:N-formylglutamate deformylase
MTQAKIHWNQVVGESPCIALSIHSGHEMRQELLSLIKISEEDRYYEEDPFTDRIASVFSNHITCLDSRYEYDLNRERDKAVYLKPEDAWGQDVWQEEPDKETITHSLQNYDSFYENLKNTLSALVRIHKHFILFDIHSYNVRSGDPFAYDEKNPQINLGTANMDRRLWGPIFDCFIKEVAGQTFRGDQIDVRENVNFKGGYLSKWVRENFPDSGCVLSIEVKKNFMNPRTGALDESALREIIGALEISVDPILNEMDRIKRRRSKKTIHPSVSRPIRIGFVVNDVMTEEAGYTTIRMAKEAIQMGHEAWIMGVGDLSYDDENVKAHAVTVPKQVYKNTTSFLRDVQGRKGVREKLVVGDLDILMLRNDPAQDATARPWAANAGIIFGRLAVAKGVVVLNDPNGLATATSKMYFFRPFRRRSVRTPSFREIGTT